MGRCQSQRYETKQYICKGCHGRARTAPFPHDSNSGKIVVDALQSAMSRTRCMLMVTHRLGVIRSLGVNKVVVLERGKLMEVGNPEDLLRSTESLYAQLAFEQGIVPLGACQN